MNIDSLRISLREVAKQLRPVGRATFVPLVKLAWERGIEIQLRFYRGDKSREAQSDLSSVQPKIFIYRRSEVDGVMAIMPDKEHLLTPRERFSIAHELGHCLAFKDFNAVPLLRAVDPMQYRKQENCMDEFAASLLVPDWLAKFWLANVSKEKPVSPHSLTTWAHAECGVSGEVVANALTRVEPTIGFLKAAEGVRVANDKRIFVVAHSSYGAKLQLPNRHSFIEDETFIKTIDGIAGGHWIDVCYLGEAKCEKVNVAWQEANVFISQGRKEFKSTVKLSGRGYWISIRSYCRSGVPTTKQLGLFD